jgi:hypothetical protein
MKSWQPKLKHGNAEERSMRNVITGFVFAAVLMALPSSNAAAQSPEGPIITISQTAFAQGAANMQSREFRRCMRQKYGRNYFRGVPRAHRFHMASACGG